MEQESSSFDFEAFLDNLNVVNKNDEQKSDRWVRNTLAIKELIEAGSNAGKRKRLKFNKVAELENELAKLSNEHEQLLGKHIPLAKICDINASRVLQLDADNTQLKTELAGLKCHVTQMEAYTKDLEFEKERISIEKNLTSSKNSVRSDNARLNHIILFGKLAANNGKLTKKQNNLLKKYLREAGEDEEIADSDKEIDAIEMPPSCSSVDTGVSSSHVSDDEGWSPRSLFPLATTCPDATNSIVEEATSSKADQDLTTVKLHQSSQSMFDDQIDNSPLSTESKAIESSSIVIPPINHDHGDNLVSANVMFEEAITSTKGQGNIIQFDVSEVPTCKSVGTNTESISQQNIPQLSGNENIANARAFLSQKKKSIGTNTVPFYERTDCATSPMKSKSYLELNQHEASPDMEIENILKEMALIKPVTPIPSTPLSVRKNIRNVVVRSTTKNINQRRKFVRTINISEETRKYKLENFKLSRALCKQKRKLLTVNKNLLKCDKLVNLLNCFTKEFQTVKKQHTHDSNENYKNVLADASLGHSNNDLHKPSERNLIHSECSNKSGSEELIKQKNYNLEHTHNIDEKCTSVLDDTSVSHTNNCVSKPSERKIIRIKHSKNTLDLEINKPAKQKQPNLIELFGDDTYDFETNVAPLNKNEIIAYTPSLNNQIVFEETADTLVVTESEEICNVKKTQKKRKMTKLDKLKNKLTPKMKIPLVPEVSSKKKQKLTHESVFPAAKCDTHLQHSGKSSKQLNDQEYYDKAAKLMAEVRVKEEAKEKRSLTTLARAKSNTKDEKQVDSLKQKEIDEIIKDKVTRGEPTREAIKSNVMICLQKLPHDTIQHDAERLTFANSNLSTDEICPVKSEVKKSSETFPSEANAKIKRTCKLSFKEDTFNELTNDLSADEIILPSNVEKSEKRRNLPEENIQKVDLPKTDYSDLSMFAWDDNIKLSDLYSKLINNKKDNVSNLTKTKIDEIKRKKINTSSFCGNTELNKSQHEIITSRTLRSHARSDLIDKNLRASVCSSREKRKRKSLSVSEEILPLESRTLRILPENLKNPTSHTPEMKQDSKSLRKTLSSATESNLTAEQKEKDNVQRSINTMPKIITTEYTNHFTSTVNAEETHMKPLSNLQKDKNSKFFEGILSKYGRQQNRKTAPVNFPAETINAITNLLEQSLCEMIDEPSTIALNFLVSQLEKENHKHFTVALLEFLMASARDQDILCKTNMLREPPMTKPEKTLLCVINELQKKWPTVQLFENILKYIEYKLLRLGVTPPMGKVENLARFYATICRKLRLMYRLRMFMADALYCMNFKAMPLIKQCLEVWMSVLPLAHLAQASTPLVQVLVHVIYFFRLDHIKSGDYVTALKRTLTNKYSYNVKNFSEEDVLQRLSSYIGDLRDNESEKKTLSTALVLISKRKGVKWCQKHIVEGMLTPLIKEKTTSDYVKAFCITLLGKLMKPYPDRMKLQCEMALGQLLLLLDEKPSFVVEQAILVSLILLRQHNKLRVFRILKMWTPRQEISAELKQEIKKMVQEIPLNNAIMFLFEKKCYLNFLQ